MLFNEYPYMNLTDINLDWIIAMIKKLRNDIDDFVNINTIKYSDPIIWDITRQYEMNTVVVDAVDGSAYLSVRPVPTGVIITNTNYWTPIFNYGEALEVLRDQITTGNERRSSTATRAFQSGDLVIFNHILYQCTTDIPIGTAFIPGSNITEITIEAFVNQLVASERSARTAADQYLSTDIANEINARTAADTDLSSRITAEADTRYTRDQELNDRILVNNSPYQRKFIFIGDSYNAANHNGGWGAAVIENFGLTTGVNAWNSGVGGASFGNSNNSFYNQLVTIANSIGTDIRATISDIVIGGAINDWSNSYADIVAGVNRCNAYAAETFPNAKVWILLCSWSYENATIRAGAINAYRTIVEHAGRAAVIDKLYTLFLDPYFLESDMVHPTAGGTAALAALIGNVLNGGNALNREYTDLYCDFVNVTDPANGITIFGNISDSGYHLYKTNSNGLRFDSAPITLGHGSTATKVASHSGANGNNFFMRECSFPVSMMLNHGTGGTDFTDARGIVTVKKVEGAEIWDMYISCESYINGDYAVQNVIGIYLLFDVMIDPTKS